MPLTRFLTLNPPDVSDSKPYSAFARVQDHLQELRRYFGLPEDELFLDEFYCALHKRFLLQGRMYIFEHYLCFYSNVFGWAKQKVIPLDKIKSISKKRYYGFPNAFEVVWRKREFFTSFLNRNDAYELLCDAVKHIQSSQATSEEIEGKDGSGGSSSSNSSTNLTGRQSGNRSPKRNNKAMSDAVDEDSDLEVVDDDIDIWSVILGSAPDIPDNMELLSEDTFDVSVQEFFARTLSTDSMFLDGYHKRRGDTRYRISEWEQLHGISGFVRQATFVSPVKGVRGIGFISPKNTECNQDHRLCVYQGDHLVFQISQVMKDIPYGDNFSVETRWDVRPKGAAECRISIHVAVPFIRSVLAPFRSMIESNVMREMQESVAVMTEMLKETLMACSNSMPQNPKLITRDPIEVSPRTGPVLAKLESLLVNEGGIQKLEQLIESTELRQSRMIGSMEMPPNLSTASMPLPQTPVVSPMNWILFFACLFMLFCQVMLVLMWMVVPSSQNYTHDRLEGFLDHPIKQLHELETTLTSIIRMLNSTLIEVQAMRR